MSEVSAATPNPSRRPRQRAAGGPSRKAATVESPPLRKKNPSNADVIRVMEQVHDCLHETSREMREGLEKVHTRVSAVKDQVHKVSVDVARLQGAQDATSKALGIPTAEGEVLSKPKKTLALLTPAKAVWMAFGTFGAAMVGYRVIASIGPHAWEFLKAVHQILLTAATS